MTRNGAENGSALIGRDKMNISNHLRYALRLNNLFLLNRRNEIEIVGRNLYTNKIFATFPVTFLYSAKKFFHFNEVPRYVTSIP